MTYTAYALRAAAPLRGATVEAITDDGGFVGLVFRCADGQQRVAWVQRDPEGNGPGWLEIEVTKLPPSPPPLSAAEKLAIARAQEHRPTKAPETRDPFGLSLWLLDPRSRMARRYVVQAGKRDQHVRWACDNNSCPAAEIPPHAIVVSGTTKETGIADGRPVQAHHLGQHFAPWPQTTGQALALVGLAAHVTRHDATTRLSDALTPTAR